MNAMTTWLYFAVRVARVSGSVANFTAKAMMSGCYGVTLSRKPFDEVSLFLFLHRCCCCWLQAMPGLC